MGIFIVVIVIMCFMFLFKKIVSVHKGDGMTLIKKCVCEHEYQDKIHGKNNRAMNDTGKSKGGSVKTYRCTV